MAKAFLFPLIASVMLTGCDTPVEYQFVAENSTETDIALIFSTPQARKELTIHPHQSALLTTTVEITRTRDDYFKEGLHVFDSIEVMRGGVASRRKISDRRFWKLTWTKADQAVYLVSVGPEFF